MLRKLLLFVQLFALLGIACADEKQVKSKTIEKDGIQINVGGLNGYSIRVDGTPFCSASTLNVVDPGWHDRYYGYIDDRTRATDSGTTGIAEGAAGLTYRLSNSRSSAVEGTQTLEILKDRQLRIATDIRMTTDSPGILEHRIAGIVESWLSNVPWTATFYDGQTSEGQTPKWAKGPLPSETTLMAEFRNAKFETPAGPLEISLRGNAKISLIDYRRSQWAEGEKFYWFGILGSPLPKDEVLSYEVIFKFPPPLTAARSYTTAELSRELTFDNIYEPQPATDQIIPTPKQLAWGAGVLETPREIGVHFAIMPAAGTTKNSGENYDKQWHREDLVSDAKARLDKVSDRWEKKFGIRLKPASESNATVKIRFSHAHDLPDYQADECYSVHIADNVFLDMRTTMGLQNAFHTLEQLIRFEADGKPGFRRADITDYPSMPFRGIHFFTGKDARDLQIKMLSEILAPLKINNLVYQIDYTKWASQPRIHSDMLGMDKADVKAVGDAAKALGINVIPLVNTFGHSEWLLQRPFMRHFADDPDDPYAYDPSNPEVYRICEEIYREAIEMFNPLIMHIGHDEIHLVGFPKKEANKAIGATQLVINDIRHYYEFLKKQGIRTMMWGDMFLGPGEAPDAALAPSVEEARRRRDLLPKDIIITDWHYKSAPVEDYKSMAIFNESGFETVACPWYSPDNIVRLARAASLQREKTSQSLGLLQTTWAGYSFDEKSMINSMEQYAAYVLAAEAAWSGGTTDSRNVTWNFYDEFLRRWNGELGGGPSKKGWIVSLDKVANAFLSEDQLNLAPGALDGLQTGKTRLGNYNFLLSSLQGKLAGVFLRGAWDKMKAQNDHNEVKIVLDTKADTIYLALATPVSIENAGAVGQGKITLEDGSTHKVDFRYGINIMSITDDRQTLLSPIVWNSADVNLTEGGAAVHIYRWTNPRPEIRIKSLKLKADKTGPGMLLLGVSGH